MIDIKLKQEDHQDLLETSSKHHSIIYMRHIQDIGMQTTKYFLSLTYEAGERLS